MNRKILVIMFGILAVGIVTAMLVNYYSNTVTSTATSKSPLESSIIDAQTTGYEQDVSFTEDTLTASLYGGEQIVVDANLENLANATISNLLGEIKFDAINISVLDFTVDYADEEWQGDIPLCASGGSVYAYIGPEEGYSIEPGQENPHIVTITFSQNAVGTYTATSKVIDVSVRVC